MSAEGEVRERRGPRRRAYDHTPERLATGPHPVWSWAMTTLTGPVTWRDDSWYGILDLARRDGVGWMVAQRARAALAHRLIQRTWAHQGRRPGPGTIQAARLTSTPGRGGGLTWGA